MQAPANRENSSGQPLGLKRMIIRRTLKAGKAQAGRLEIDRITPGRRSRNMARIRGQNTKPEIEVRRLLHAAGYRFRLHDRRLPGTPDIIFPKRRKVIFVHGCFWHRHEGCRFAANPATRTDFWIEKFRRNVERDAAAQKALASEGWQVLVLWECEIKRRSESEERLKAFLGPTSIG